nr:larval cuticle protein 1-like isoform X2 [Danaus plexippus plexippus]
MKMFIVALALVACVAALPVEKDVPKILRYDFDPQPNGGYSLNVETDDGIVRYEVAELKEILDENNKPQFVLVVRGQYSYPRSDGSIETISYVADELGFRPEGASIPQAPAAARR